MNDVTVTVLDPSVELRLHRLTGAFLAGYRNVNTRTAYLQQLHRWFAWCTANQLDPLEVERTHVELYLRWFERQVGSVNTVCHGLSVLASFYRWLVQTGLLDTTPIAAVRRPSRDETPRQTRLTRHELADWLNAAEQTGGAVYAMACLLLLNGLRVSEVCGIDIDDLAEERWHHTVIIHGKGDKDATIPLAPRARAAVEQAVDGRDDGPLLRNRWNNRMSRNNVAAAVATLATRAGIARRMVEQRVPKRSKHSFEAGKRTLLLGDVVCHGEKPGSLGDAIGGAAQTSRSSAKPTTRVEGTADNARVIHPPAAVTEVPPPMCTCA